RLTNKYPLRGYLQLRMTFNVELIKVFMGDVDASCLVQDNKFSVFVFILFRCWSVAIGGRTRLHRLTDRFAGKHTITNPNHAINVAGDGAVMAYDERGDM